MVCRVTPYRIGVKGMSLLALARGGMVEWWKADLVTVRSDIPSTTSGRQLWRADLRGSPVYHGSHMQTGL